MILALCLLHYISRQEDLGTVMGMADTADMVVDKVDMVDRGNMGLGRDLGMV